MLKLITLALAAAIAVNGAAIAATRDTTKIKACGVEWKAAKADPAIKAAGWPKFWSACAKRANA